MTNPKHRNIGFLTSELAYRDKEHEETDLREVTDLIEEVSDAVETGSPHSVPGNWGRLVRQLYQEQDFFVRGHRVFKKVDSIADAKDGNAGRDSHDGDKDLLDGEFSSVMDKPGMREWLEEHKEQLADLRIKPTDAMNFAENGLDGDQISGFFSLMDTVSLNSPHCAMGYHPPRDRYQLVAWEHRSRGTSEAHRRKTLLADLRAELSDITDENDLNDFLARIRDDYYEDKKLRQQWNSKAFQEDRELYLRSLRAKNLDEETIRRKLFMCFDAERHEILRLYKIVNGKKTCINERDVKQSKKSFDSLWRRKRIEAMNELTLTTSQWTEIYNLSKHIRIRARRIKQGFKPAVPRKYDNMRQMILTADPNSLSRVKSEIMTNSDIPYEYRLELAEMVLLWSERLLKKGVKKNEVLLC